MPDTVSCPICGQPNSTSQGGLSCSHLIARTFGAGWEDQVLRHLEVPEPSVSPDSWRIAQHQFLRAFCKVQGGLVFSERSAPSMRDRLIGMPSSRS